MNDNETPNEHEHITIDGEEIDVLRPDDAMMKLALQASPDELIPLGVSILNMAFDHITTAAGDVFGTMAVSDQLVKALAQANPFLIHIIAKMAITAFALRMTGEEECPEEYRTLSGYANSLAEGFAEMDEDFEKARERFKEIQAEEEAKKLLENLFNMPTAERPEDEDG